MPQVTETFNREATQQIPPHVFAQCDRLDQTEACALGVATVVLDLSGVVRYCDPEAARLFGASTYMLQGQPIGALIPNLPLKPETPGYNIAYATFHADAGLQRRFNGIHSQGREIGLDVSLTILRIVGGYNFRLNLRQAPASIPATRQIAECGAMAAVTTAIALPA